MTIIIKRQHHGVVRRGIPNKRCCLWESDANSDFFHDDNSTDESISLRLDNPAGCSSRWSSRLDLFEAGNDWWWAIDNLKVLGTGGGGGIVGDFNGDGVLDAATSTT